MNRKFLLSVGVLFPLFFSVHGVQATTGSDFKYNIFVAGYGKRNQLDTLLFVGFVENAQEKMLQIRVNTWVQEVDLFDLQGNIKQEILSSIEIRPVIPRQAIDVLTNNGGY